MTIFQKGLNFVDCVYQITFIHRVIPQVHIIAIRLTEYNHPDIFINTRFSCSRFRRVSQVMECKTIFTFPASLTICPGNVCNLNCVLCPTGQNDGGRKKGLLSLELFKKVMDECGPYLWEVDLYNWGEPFLNRKLFEMVRYSKIYKVKVGISTNLNHFNDTICSELVLSGVDKVIVSLDGASQESVSQYQVGSDFSKVMANIKKIGELQEGIEF